MMHKANQMFLGILLCVASVGAPLLFPGSVLANFTGLRNMDFENIHFTLIFQGNLDLDWQNQLSYEAERIFMEAGLNPLPAIVNMPPDGEASLTITITAIPLDEVHAEDALGGRCHGPSNWLYDAKIELWERMYAARNPQHPVYSKIWGEGYRFSRLRKQLDYEEIRRQVKGMLLTFIADYRLANPKQSE